MLVQRDLRRQIRCVTLHADIRVVRGRLRTLMQIMRVVACLACQCALAPEIALGLPQSVRRAHDLEVVGAAFLRIADEVGVETRERLIGL